MLIVVSDGGDNASPRSLDQVMKLAEQSSAVIYTVGVFDEDDPDRNPGVLKRLARATGGEAFLPEQARAKWWPSASASPATFAINTLSDMFPATRLVTVLIVPFGCLPGLKATANSPCARAPAT